MRIGLTLISLLTLVAAPLAAQTVDSQWAVRPAPESWGLPQSSAPQAPQYQGAPTSTANLEDALICSAALQLATMASPGWARERGITDITNAWLQKVFALAEPQGIGGDRVPGLVEAEMQRQIEDAARDPAILSRRAFDCASRQP